MAKRAGQDVTRWEDGWIKLLRQYEKTCADIAALERATK